MRCCDVEIQINFIVFIHVGDHIIHYAYIDVTYKFDKIAFIFLSRNVTRETIWFDKTWSIFS